MCYVRNDFGESGKKNKDGSPELKFNNAHAVLFVAREDDEYIFKNSMEYHEGKSVIEQVRQVRASTSKYNHK